MKNGKHDEAVVFVVPKDTPKYGIPKTPFKNGRGVSVLTRCMTQTACRHLIAVLAPESTTTNKERDDGSTTTGG